MKKHKCEYDNDECGCPYPDWDGIYMCNMCEDQIFYKEWDESQDKRAHEEALQKQHVEQYWTDLKLNHPHQYIYEIKRERAKQAEHITTIYNVDKCGKRTVCKRTIN